MSRELGVALPFWLDRPDEEAVEIAVAAERAGIAAVWAGEMASFDAFALATAIGFRTERIRLRIGPLAVGVRSPVAIALGVGSVATLTGRPVDVALGSSSPAIVSGWHERPWTALADRMRETVLALRPLLEGHRANGFKLRRPQPGASIIVAAFGPRVTRVAAQCADEVVLNLVAPDQVARVRAKLDEDAAAIDRAPPRLSVWVPVALDPGARAIAQLAGQLAIYLGLPGYGEMLSELGFGSVVERARGGASRSELAGSVPPELIGRLAAIGDAGEIQARLGAYFDAGADHVAVVPSTAEDPAGRRVLDALTPEAMLG